MSSLEGVKVRPDVVLAGECTQLAMTGLVADADVRLVVERRLKTTYAAASRLYRAEAVFRSSATGSIDLAVGKPINGTYADPDVRGLFWSMLPTESTELEDWPNHRVLLTAERDGQVLGSAPLTLLNSESALEAETLAPEFPGAVLVRPKVRGRRAALIVLGGSEGGDQFSNTVARRFASRGYAVVGLPYYAPFGGRRPDLSGLPSAFVDIPIDRLQDLFTFLCHRTDIDPERIGLYGVSKGAEFALLAATRLRWIKAVAAIAPSDVVWEGWGIPEQVPGTRSSFSWGRSPLPFVPYECAPRHEVTDRRYQHDRGRAAHPDRALAARIPVEAFRGPLLVAAGEDDRVWDSATMARNIVECRDRAKLKTTAVFLAEAGHAISGHGWNPTSHTVHTGGTAAGNARAQAEAWRRTLAFFADCLM